MSDTTVLWLTLIMNLSTIGIARSLLRHAAEGLTNSIVAKLKEQDDPILSVLALQNKRIERLEQKLHEVEVRTRQLRI